MDGTSIEPLAPSVAGSTTNQMEGIEGEEQSALRNVDSIEQPTPLICSFISLVFDHMIMLVP